MKSRVAILVTVLSTGLAGSAAGFAANRASAPLPPSAASTSVGDGTPASSTPAPPTTPAAPAAPSQVPTTAAEPITPTSSAEPTPTPTSAQTTPTFSSRPIYSPAWDITSLLTAGEFARAGLPRRPVDYSASPGYGQAVLGMCDPHLEAAVGARSFFRGDAYYRDQHAYAGQLTARFSTSGQAKRAVEGALASRATCDVHTVAPSGPWTSSPLRRMVVSGASVVTWTMTPTRQGASPEIVMVLRSGAFVSVVLISGSTAQLGGIDRDSLADSAAARLP